MAVSQATLLRVLYQCFRVPVENRPRPASSDKQCGCPTVSKGLISLGEDQLEPHCTGISIGKLAFIHLTAFVEGLFVLDARH